MAKKPTATGGKKVTAPAKKKFPVKKSPAKKTLTKTAIRKAAKKAPKKEVSEKERNLREANLIANNEKKKGTKRPKKSATQQQTTSLLDAIVDGLHEKKAKNITILNMDGIESRVADYFVIADADSKTHVDSIADSVEDIVIKKTAEKAYHSEGHQNSEWILIDYINIVVHVFVKDIREYYNLEGMWGDAQITVVN
jgi:ribosome-associated protein